MRTFLQSLVPDDARELSGLAGGAAAWALAAVMGKGGTVVVEDSRAADRILRSLRFFASGRTVLPYPADDGRYWDGNVRDPERSQARILARAAKHGIVVVESRALLPRVPALCAVEVKRGTLFPPGNLVNALVARGYLVSPTCDEPGTVSRRGGGVDAWGIGETQATRISWFDDEIEAVRGPTRLLPAREGVLEAASAERAAAYIHAVASERGIVGQDRRQVLTDLRAGIWFASAEDYLPALGAVGIVQLPSPIFVVEPDRVELALHAAEQEIHRRFEQLPVEERPLVRPEDRYASAAEVAEWLANARPVRGGGAGFATLTNPQIKVGHTGELQPVAAELFHAARSGAAVTVVVDDAARAERIRQLFEPHGVRFGGAASGAIALAVGDLAEGFWSDELVFVTADEIFGDKLRSDAGATVRKFRQAATVGLGKLDRGDLVVHSRHGIGVFRGLSRMPLGEAMGDFVLIEYRDGDKLYVPVWKLDLVAPYRAGEGSEKPRLDKLGGLTWEVRRAKVRDAVLKLAAEILRIHAHRKVETAPVFDAAGSLYSRFEEAFPFVETPDQRDAIEAVLIDLASGHPMDRLVVGDVGFGKTEVAMRAAFRVVLGGGQVLILVPTTVLAWQHFSSFEKRLGEFGARVGMLSRFVDGPTARDVREKLASGGLDVVIATTAALGRAVRFANLGLVVIDEEHRFGTKQKEESRRIARGVHYLALSATPIPRTLHMALGGLREMSLITTPPEGRREIHTEVVRFEPERIREEILRELQRGGQVYFLHNRVTGMPQFAQWLRELVPEARIGIGHAQLADDALERVLSGFAAREFDILLCTTIIENGLDLPDVNLVLIDGAQQFGVAQLYQIRGRVGRRDVAARCLLLVDGSGIVAKSALQRLLAVQEASTLGSGFNLASRDLEMRGGGEILGDKQHGHIAAIGFDAYVELLGEAVAQVRGEARESRLETEVDVPVVCVLPEDWIPDTAARLQAYSDLANAEADGRVRGVFAMLVSRHGDAPLEAENLARLTLLRVNARSLGIAKVAMLKVRAVFELSERHKLDGMRLMELCATQPQRWKRSGTMGIEVRCTPEEAADPFAFLDWALGRMRVG